MVIDASTWFNKRGVMAIYYKAGRCSLRERYLRHPYRNWSTGVS